MSFYFSDISTFVKRIIKIFWLANAAFSKLQSIFKSNAVSTEVKYKLFEAYITSIFTYNCELWTLAKELENEIDVFQRCLLRQILKVHYPRKITVWENSPSTFVTNSEIQTLKGAWTKKLSNSNCTQGSSQKSEKTQRWSNRHLVINCEQTIKRTWSTKFWNCRNYCTR